jgi:nitrite reductase/ring-hydroxylating ferredoxin subunit
MKTRIAQVLLAALVFVLLGTLGCSGSKAESTTGGKVQPTWIDAQVDADAISIPLSDIEGGKMIHFKVTSGGTDMTFMAYALSGQINIRAAICPPCRSQSFSLAGDILDCDTCHTKFKADTGEGISGACKNYPKAEVAYTITRDRISTETGDLIIAYQNTQSPGLP